eukprot:TRINITY_DN9687_c0_g11_i1.p1 TRINITY_DN9687_c0_g11~~TRINITY_DN9687_c0_g11_i1.p1  ORF type:complete len:384 (-),score=82.97 TRINITY_DN9687_c0_g11_i1:264-1415(-)
MPEVVCICSLAIYKATGVKKPKGFGGAIAITCTVKTVQNPKARFEKDTTNIRSNEELDVFCINCMRMVKVSLAPEHSLHCTQVRSEVLLIDQCSLIQQADYKIRRLSDSIAQLKKDPQLQLDRDQCTLQMLTEYAEDILGLTDFTKIDILKCRETIFNTVTLIKGFRGSPRLAIQLERFLVVTKEKYGQMISYYKEISNADTARLKSQEELKRTLAEKTERLRESLYAVAENRLSSKSYNPMQIKDVNQVNMEVNSDIGLNEYSNMLSVRVRSDIDRGTITSAISVADEKEVDEALKLQGQQRMHNANLKRYFYTLVANAKKAIGNRNMGYYVNSALLFKEVVRTKKEVDEWPDFVIKELNTNPMKWIEKKKLDKIQSLYCLI